MISHISIKETNNLLKYIADLPKTVNQNNIYYVLVSYTKSSSSFFIQDLMNKRNMYPTTKAAAPPRTIATICPLLLLPPLLSPFPEQLIIQLEAQILV